MLSFRCSLKQEQGSAISWCILTIYKNTDFYYIETSHL
jgi:hypothetical protein